MAIKMWKLYLKKDTIRNRKPVEFFYTGCDMIHSIQSVNNAAESILNFLKFSNTGTAESIYTGCHNTVRVIIP